MADTIEAPADTQATQAPQVTESENNPTTNQTTTPDLHGFTEAELADMRKFYDANGGYEKVKSRLSNPPKAVAPTQPTLEAPVQQTPPTPQGAITQQEFMARQYFNSLAAEQEFSPIATQIRDGSVLREMAEFGISPLNQDGSLNDLQVRKFLTLKAQTVPATPPSTPESNSPTVEYVPTGENGTITSIDQAYAVLTQDGTLKRMGQAGHPAAQAAEAFIKEQYNKK